jgi:hypothetical protein
MDRQRHPCLREFYLKDYSCDSRIKFCFWEVDSRLVDLQPNESYHVVGYLVFSAASLYGDGQVFVCLNVRRMQCFKPKTNVLST